MVEFFKKTINSSPYLGVFCSLNEKFLIHPLHAEKKELQGLKKLEIELIPAAVASSSLIGIFSKSFDGKIIVTNMSEEKEINHLKAAGLKVMQTNSTAIGNLIALNEHGGIASPLLPKKQVEEISEFFGVKFHSMAIGGSDLTGACVCVTNKGFIVHPHISEKEFESLKKIFKVNGSPATANCGDRFVGNSVIANSKGIAAGMLTTGPELSRIDEGLRGD